MCWKYSTNILTQRGVQFITSFKSCNLIGQMLRRAISFHMCIN